MLSLFLGNPIKPAMSISDLLKEFGRHLLKRFVSSFPVFFEGIGSTLAEGLIPAADPVS
jgi:hypothetical protein